MMQEKFRIPTRELDARVVEEDYFRNNLLQFAVMEGFYDLVEELVRGEGMNIKQPCPNGLTPLQIPALHPPGEWTLKIMKLLIWCGAYTYTDTVLLDYVSKGVDGVDWMPFPCGNIVKFLVEDIGIPVTQNVLKNVASDPEIFAMCQNASSSPRSLKKLARLAVLKTHKVDKMPDGHIPEELRRFLCFQEGEEE